MTRLDLVRGGGVAATGLANGFSSNSWTLSGNADPLANDPADRARTRKLPVDIPGVARVYWKKERGEIGLDNWRSGDLVLLAEPDAWFAYPFWLDDNFAPDYARTVAIHHKPGYDPCELFFDPTRRSKLRAAWRLLQKKLGFRMKMDVIPLDARLVRGSHGLAASDVRDRPLLIGDGPTPPDDLAMTDVYGLLMNALTNSKGPLP